MTIAHDLKTPLSVIVGYAELLQARTDPVTLKDAPSMILEAATRLGDELDALAERVGVAAGGARNASTRALRGDFAAKERRLRSRILVVDDDEDLRRLLRATFADDEFDVTEAGDGREALSAVAATHPDVVVLDWQLPALSGAEVLAELSTQPSRPYIIVLTAFGEADPTGADAFLLKPFSPIELLELIADLLSRGPREEATG